MEEKLILLQNTIAKQGGALNPHSIHVGRVLASEQPDTHVFGSFRLHREAITCARRHSLELPGSEDVRQLPHIITLTYSAAKRKTNRYAQLELADK